jgi:replication factor C subunit 1
MVQENYIKTKGGGNQLEELEALALAADSISEGEVVDRFIHGSQQQWSLLPVHGVFSCVRPTYFCRNGGQGRYDFAGWLGQNSKANKNLRLLGEIQVHSRLHTSSSLREFREVYVPALFPLLYLPLVHQGKDAIARTMRIMDHYYWTKDDWDHLGELQLVEHAHDKLFSKLTKDVKAAFTRAYNKASHPTALSGPITVSKQSAQSLDAPDLEEAAVDDVIEAEEEEKEKEVLPVPKPVKSKGKKKE